MKHQLKNKTLQILLGCTMLLCLFGCSKEIDSASLAPQPENAPLPQIPKVLSGTFIDFWYKGDWTQSQWDNHLQEMKDLGLSNLILQFTAYGEYTWFNSANTFATTKFPHALSRFLTAAEKKNMNVYIGLYFHADYWNKQTNATWLLEQANRCNFIATEIQGQFGNNPAFKGWYIPHEPEPYAYHSSALTEVFTQNLVNKISDSLHKLNNKPVSIAAFFNSSLSTPTGLRNLMQGLGNSNLQMIMLQDGVGVNHVSLSQLPAYYEAASAGLYTDAAFTGEFWADLETFNTPQAPANMERIKAQLKAAAETPRLSKIVSFQYFNDMCPTGPYGSNAKKLRTDYLNYLKTQ